MRHATFYVSLMTVLLLSCQKEKEIDIPTTKTPEVKKESAELRFSAVVQSQFKDGETRAGRIGEITSFVDTDRIGVYLATDTGVVETNVPYYCQEGRWRTDKEVVIRGKSKVYAYYPYTEAMEGYLMPIDIDRQEDVLYAHPVEVNLDTPFAQMRMRHALSMLSIYVAKGGYTKEGKITEVALMNTPRTGTLDIRTGQVRMVKETGEYRLQVNKGLAQRIDMIVPPLQMNELSQNLKIRLKIDGEDFAIEVPKEQVWEQGKKYTYHLTLPDSPETEPEVKIDVEYWSKYGKDDQIEIEDHSQGDSPTGHIMQVQSCHWPTGKCLVRGEAHFLEVYIDCFRLTPDKKRYLPFKGEYRFALYQNGKRMELFPPYSFDFEGWSTLCCPCFITSPAGEYKLRVLIKGEGTTTWVIPEESTWDESEWIYTISEDNTAPSIRNIALKGKKPTTLITSVKDNIPFTLTYTLTNRAKVALDGEIKAVWGRKFNGEFFSAWNKRWAKDPDKEYEFEIGRVSIRLSAEQTSYQGEIECKLGYVERGKQFGNKVHFYYRASGSSEWKLMRPDADAALENQRKNLRYYYKGGGVYYRAEDHNYMNLDVEE